MGIWGSLKAVGLWVYNLGLSMGGPGLLLIAIADSSFLSIPEGNDILIVALSIGASWARMSYLAVMTIVGSVIGCVLLFLAGKRGGLAILEKRFSARSVQRAEEYVQRYGILSVMIPSILPPPMPFKIFVLTAGVFQLSLGRFLIAVVLGRTIRYFTWGILAVVYGEQVKEFIGDHLTQVGVALLAVMGVLVVGALLWHYLRKKDPQSGEDRP